MSLQRGPPIASTTVIYLVSLPKGIESNDAIQISVHKAQRMSFTPSGRPNRIDELDVLPRVHRRAIDRFVVLTPASASSGNVGCCWPDATFTGRMDDRHAVGLYRSSRVENQRF